MTVPPARDPEAQYRALFDYAPDGIVIADAQAYYRDANAAMCRMLGYTRDELIGLHATDIVVPEEIKHIEPALSTIAAKAEYSREWCFRRKDGTTFDAEVMATAMPDGNILAIVRDVSQRKAAGRELSEREAQLRLASQVAKLGAWSVEVATGRIKWSDELCAMRGVPNGTMPTRAQQIESYAPEYRELITSQAEACVREGTPFDVEIQLVDAQQRRSWARVIGQAERDASGAIVRVHGAFQDIDERRKLEERLRQAQKMEAIGQLAGGVAHDFNNLLTIILGYTKLLLEDAKPGDPSRDDLEQIRHAAERAAQLTQQLLAFGRKQMLQLRVMDLGQTLRGLEKMLRRLLGEDIELALSTSSALGKVLADASQMEQIIMNLAVNARDAMPRGGKLLFETSNVEVSAGEAIPVQDLEPGRYVKLAVTDNGIGMDAATRERAFEPFFTTKEQGKGTGLGLSTVFGIVKQSHGHIWVYSELGHGTSFMIYLPRTDQAEEPTATSLPPTRPMRGSETILLVEDDAQLRGVTREQGERGA